MLHEDYFNKVYFRYWKSDSNVLPKAHVFAIHGLGGHSLWFDEAAKIFNKNSINFFSFDLPGFGQSKYPIGEITSYREWIDTAKEVYQTFIQRFNIKLPIFVLGHSMGASIAILMSKDLRTNGWILSVPGFEGNKDTWPVTKVILPVLFKSICKPKENILLPFGPEALTKNKETQLKIKKDPLRVVNINASMFMQVYLLSKKSRYSHRFLIEPLLLLMSGNDIVCSNEAMESFFSVVKNKNKTKKIYSTAMHDLFVEDELEEIVTDIVSWINEQIGS